MLINGYGLAFGRSEESGDDVHQLPPASFEVARGLRHRFRVVSPGFTLCPVQVWVDGHDLLVVASDGAPMSPVTVRSFIIHPGERWVMSDRSCGSSTVVTFSIPAPEKSSH